MTRSALALTMLAFGLSAAPLLAGPLADQAGLVESKIAEQDTLGALAALDALSAEVWSQLPNIAFTRVALVTQQAPFFGIYNERGDARFKPGEPILIYAEPVGFGYGQPKEGIHAIQLAVDVEVMSEAGELLGGFKDLAKIEYNSRSPMREVPANLELNLSGISPGKYVLKVTIRDQNSPKTGAFDLDIEIAQ